MKLQRFQQVNVRTGRSGLRFMTWAAVTASSVFAVSAIRADEVAKATPAEVLTEEVKVLQDVPYKSGQDLSPLEKERCKADLYLPAKHKDFPVVVWFHGGGLTAGDKGGDGTSAVARHWAKAGIAVVVANYRLSPRVTFPAYLQDGAAAVAWARETMSQYGADRTRLFVGGHSAGAYMALMIGMDKKLLEEAGLKREDLAGLIPVSGQTMTHFTVRVERGEPKERTVVDEAAPVYLAGKNVPPMLLLVGDQDMKTRWEENAYFAAQCRALGATNVHLLKIKDRNHGSIFRELQSDADRGYQAVKAFVADPLNARF